jgi:hypothetical protein
VRCALRGTPPTGQVSSIGSRSALRTTRHPSSTLNPSMTPVLPTLMTRLPPSTRSHATATSTTDPSSMRIRSSTSSSTLRLTSTTPWSPCSTSPTQRVLPTTMTTSMTNQCSTPNWSSTASTRNSPCSISGPTTWWPHTLVSTSMTTPSLTRNPIVRRQSSFSTRRSSSVPTLCPLQPPSTRPSRVHRNVCVSLFTLGRCSSPRRYMSSRG